MILRLVTPPGGEPVSLDEAKAHLRLEINTDDAYVTGLIVAAREYVEKITWRALVLQTWELTLPGFPHPYYKPPPSPYHAAGYTQRSTYASDYITLPKGNLQSVASLTYLDSVGAAQTADPAVLYELDQASVPGRVLLRANQSWPETYGRWNDVKVTYAVGFSADPTQIPQAIKQAIMLLVGQMYENRVPEVIGPIISKLGFAVDALVAPYRLRRF